MENSTNKPSQPAIDTLELEGVALARMYNSEQSSLKKRFNGSVARDGLDFRLGSLMRSLRDEVGDEGKVTSSRLREVGISNIDKRRRAEALWFFDNQEECNEHIKSSKKGFTSLSALQRAMKPKAEKVEDESDVGPEKEEAATLESIVANVIATASKHNVDLQKIVEMLIESAITTSSEESEVA
tara:strand:- start:576 stop:1127 length:552 start_codon:yes stop_codon:yes gene_type:complete